jgi:hypothetical protein
MYKDKELKMSIIFFVNVWRKNIFDISVVYQGWNFISHDIAYLKKRRLDVEVLEYVGPDPQSKGVCKIH